MLYEVITLDDGGLAEWQPSFDSYAAPALQLNYLVRVYDAQGAYDETAPQPLWVLDQVDPALV